MKAHYWKELGRSRRNPSGDGRIAAFEVPELNLVAVLLVPNGGPDDECDKLRAQIVSEHNRTISAIDERKPEGVFGCIDCGEEREPIMVTGYPTCPECGSQKLTSQPI